MHTPAARAGVPEAGAVGVSDSGGRWGRPRAERIKPAGTPPAGSPWYRSDLAVAGDRIAAIGKLDGAEAGRTINCREVVLAPGFFDLHVHSDLMLLAEPRHEAKIFQGVTTELLGQDGLSYAPISRQKLLLLRRFLAGLNGDPDISWDWSTVSEFLGK